MRKLISTILMSCATFASSAQNTSDGVFQLADPGFEQYVGDGEPGNGWNSFASAIGKYTSAVGVDLKGQSPNPYTVSPGANQSARALKLMSKQISGPLSIKANANGNLTTGVINMGAMNATDPQNHNRTLLGNPRHQLRFKGRPDAVTFYAKFKAGNSNSGKCGRANFILHDRCEYQDPEIESQQAHKIGQAMSNIAVSDDWKRYELPFVYQQDSPAEQYLLASVTTNPIPGESVGDELFLDEIYFVYHHGLSALSYDGASLDFHEDSLHYDLSHLSYSKAALHYTLKGAGATAEQKYSSATGILTLTVKANDYAVNPDHQTTYTLQFDKNAVIQLDDKVLHLEDIQVESTYAIYNEAFTAYASYQPEFAGQQNYVWTTNLTGDEGHVVPQDRVEAYGQPFEITDPKNCWMVIPNGEKFYLYNVEAGMFLKTPGYQGATSPCVLTKEPSLVGIEDLGNGNFAITSSGDEHDYLCVAPQNATTPLSIWEKSDSGAAWQLKRNPTVAADLDVVREYYVPKLGEKVTAVSQLDLHKTYVLRNEFYTAYAIYAPQYSTDIVWTAEMKGGDKDHALKNPQFAEKVQLLDPNSNWMLIPQVDGCYLYNIGAKKYLSTPIEEGISKGCFFSADPVKLHIQELGNGKFAFTASKKTKDYMCAAPQLAAPVSNWDTSDPGTAWEITENPHVAGDLDLIDKLTTIPLDEPLTNLNEIDIEKTYVIRNEKFNAVALFAPEADAHHLWTAEMKGDRDHTVSNPDYAQEANFKKDNSSWMLIPQEKGYLVYNIGAKKYLSTPVEEDKNLGCWLSDEPVVIYIDSLGNGKFTLTASKKEKDYMCATPQLNVPISNWKASDEGAAWEFRPNPNVKADPEVLNRYPATAQLSDLKVFGQTVPHFQKDQYYYTVVGDYQDGCIHFSALDGVHALVEISYSANERIATVAVSAKRGNAQQVYKVKFAKATSDYVGKMLISMANMLLAVSDNPVGISAVADGKIDLQLLNFTLQGLGLVGDIFITDVPYLPNANGDVILYKEQTLTIFGLMGESLGQLPTVFEGSIIQGKFSGCIRITWQGTPIEVKIYPYNALSMDIPAKGAGGQIAAIKQQMTNPNLLVFLQEEANGQENVVVNGKCEHLVLSEDYDFDATRTFTAEKVSYLRPLATGVSSFILPCAVKAEEVNGKVYELAGLEGNTVVFRQIEGELMANRPYLCVAEQDFPTFLKKNVQAQVTPAELTEVSKGNVSHVGSLTAQSVKSNSAVGYYQVAANHFDKVNIGMIRPFHTLLKVNKASAETLTLRLEDCTTGIVSLEKDGLQLNQLVDVYDHSGRLVRRQVQAASCLLGLPQGVYIVNGHKVRK